MKEIENITSNKSITNLIALWAEEAAEWTTNRKARGNDEAVTARDVAYSYCSDFFKYEAGNGFRPRFMADYPVEELALAYANMYKEVAESDAREAEGERKVAEAMKPSPVFTIGDIFPTGVSLK